MIRIEDTSVIPEMELTEYSCRERAIVTPEFCEELVSKSLVVKLVSNKSGPLMVAGLYHPTLVSMPHFWALLTPNFSSIKQDDLKTLVRWLNKVPMVMETLIEVGNKKAARLARLFNFEPTTSFVLIGNTQMQLYRRPVCHS